MDNSTALQNYPNSPYAYLLGIISSSQPNDSENAERSIITPIMLNTQHYSGPSIRGTKPNDNPNVDHIRGMKPNDNPNVDNRMPYRIIRILCMHIYRSHLV